MIVVMGGMVAFPAYPVGSSSDRPIGPGVAPQQLGNGTTTFSSPFSSLTTTRPSGTSSVPTSMTTNGTSTVVRSTNTSSTTFSTTTFNSTSIGIPSSTSTQTYMNSTTYYTFTNSTAFRTNSTATITSVFSNTTALLRQLAVVTLLLPAAVQLVPAGTPAGVGAWVNISATVANMAGQHVPGGWFTWYVDGHEVGAGGPSIQLGWWPLSPGIHTVTVSYNGTASYLPAEASATFDVLPLVTSSTTLTSVPTTVTNSGAGVNLTGFTKVSLVNATTSLQDQIDKSLANGTTALSVNVGDYVTISGGNGSVVVRSLGSSSNSLTLVVGGSNVTGPRTILLNLSEASFLNLQSGYISVLLDNVTLSQAESLSQVLSGTGAATYILIGTSSGVELLVSIPHFSTHTLVVESMAAGPSVTTATTTAAPTGPVGSDQSVLYAIGGVVVVAAALSYLALRRRKTG